ncbi:MAG: hypothetical protein U1C57_00460 [Candidatus Doudnabacteria bacterium]|nr:hypothetical protein [bacterium]MDZ4243562.1 hypothetical protein [Candidatus Doudnabacteria bacterium]
MQPYFRQTIAEAVRRGLPKKRFELDDQQIEKLRTVSEVVLAVGIVAGTMALTVLAPNIFQALEKLPWTRKKYSSGKAKRQDFQKKITKSFYYLKNKGYVELIPDGQDFKVKISQKGRRKIRRMRFERLQIGQPESWNSRWWIVLADIPSNTHRSRADQFREKLKSINFFPLQRTAWIYPFDPRDEVGFVAAHYKVDRFVTVMEISLLDPADEKVLKEFFKL